jgi:hypothetical protein
VALIDRFMASLRRRVGHTQDWPPSLVRATWDEVALYRYRFENDRARLIQHNPLWHGDAGQYFTPIPVAYEMSRLSSSLLFSEPIAATLPVAEDDAPGEDAPEKKNPLQPGLDEVMEDSRFDEFCQESGEYVANEGLMGIKVVWDEETSDLPVITWAHGDQILWDVRHDRYVRGGAIVTERAEDRPGAPVFRLVEEHGKGYVERTLYKGSGTKLGQRVALGALDEFGELEEFEETGLDTPTLIPWKNVPRGRSDLFPVYGMLDRVDESEALLLEKARKSRPWLFATRGLADDQGRVDISNLIFMQQSEAAEYLDEKQGGRAVEHVQPSMQSEEHIAWAFHLLDLTLMMSGYSLATWGRDASGGGADSGLALKLKQARTLLTRAGKERMGRQALTRALGTALAMRENPSATNASVRVRDYLPDLALGDGLPEDPLQTAQEIQTLDSAGAISTEQKVRRANPTWDEKAVQKEVVRIKGANAAAQETNPLNRALRGELGI